MSEHTEKPRAEVDAFIMVDENGDFVVTGDEDELTELWGDRVGGTPTNSRTFHLSVSVPLPYTVEARAELPDEIDGDAVELKVSVEA